MFLFRRLDKIQHYATWSGNSRYYTIMAVITIMINLTDMLISLYNFSHVCHSFAPISISLSTLFRRLDKIQYYAAESCISRYFTNMHNRDKLCRYTDISDLCICSCVFHSFISDFVIISCLHHCQVSSVNLIKLNITSLKVALVDILPASRTSK